MFSSSQLQALPTPSSVTMGTRFLVRGTTNPNRVFEIQKTLSQLDRLQEKTNNGLLPKIKFQRGKLLLELQEFQAAAQQFGQTLESGHLPADSLAYRGMCFAHLGRYTEALSDCLDAIQREPHNPIAALVRVHVYADALGDMDEAHSILDKALEVNPSNKELRKCSLQLGKKPSSGVNPDALFMKARTLLDSRGHHQSLESFSKIIYSHPNHIPSRYSRAVIYFTKGNLVEAASDLDVCLAHDPSNQKTLLLRAVCAYRLKSVEDSLKWSSLLLEIIPDQWSCLYVRSWAYVQQKNYLSAQEDVTRFYNAVDKFQDKTTSCGCLGKYSNLISAMTTRKAFVDYQVSKEEIGNIPALERMKAALLDASRTRPFDSNVERDLAWVFSELKDWDRARERLEPLVEKYPNNKGLLFFLSRLYKELANRERSIELLSRLIELDPSDLRYHDRLAIIYLEQQKFREALPHIRVLDSRRDNCNIKATLASAYMSLGLLEEASQTIARVEKPELVAKLSRSLGIITRKLQTLPV